MHRRSLAAALAVLSVAALTSCSALSGVEDNTWTDHAALEKSEQATSVPSLVAADAADIRMRQGTLGKTGILLGWSSDSGITRSDCSAGTIPDDVGLSASWWPTTVPARGWRCGWWRVFEQDGTYYAWDHHEAG